MIFVGEVFLLWCKYEQVLKWENTSETRLYKVSANIQTSSILQKWFSSKDLLCMANKPKTDSFSHAPIEEERYLHNMYGNHESILPKKN